jgi:hypothetical protein
MDAASLLTIKFKVLGRQTTDDFKGRARRGSICALITDGQDDYGIQYDFPPTYVFPIILQRFLHENKKDP